MIMETESLLMDRNGRVVIPASIRRALKVKPGDRLVAWVEGGHLIIHTRAQVVADLKERFKRRPGEESLTESLRRERDAEAAQSEP